MIIHTVLIVLALASCIFAETPNYQERRLYYTESDNCCITKHDEIVVSVRFDDRKAVEKTIYGNTYCNIWTRPYADMINPATFMEYTQCFNTGNPDQYCDKLNFTQQATTQKKNYTITNIVQKATVRNPATFDKNDYNCVIEGDGTVQHFGPFGSIPTPRIEVKCNRVVSNLQTEERF